MPASRCALARYHRALRVEALEDRRLLALVTVDTLDDTIDLTDGRTSLREAIFATNLVPGADSIEFAPSLTAEGPATILLTRGELRISDALTITGPGSELLTINASGNDPTPSTNNGDGSRVFNIDDGNLASLIDVTISSLTVTGGDVRAGAGAIESRENVTLMGCTVSGSSAIAEDSITLSLGGGIAHSEGTLTIFGSVIAGNAADFGGGIHVASGSLLISDSDITANSGLSGAGIYQADGSAIVRRSTIRDNIAPGIFALGGGVYTSGSMTIESTTISGNTAAFGGGIFSRTDTSAAESTRIVNSTISGNTALVRGGGVRNALGQTVIAYSTITANTAPAGEGGGVASRGYGTAQTIVRSTIIAGNTASDVDFGTGTFNSFESGGFNLVGSGNALAAFHEFGDQSGVANLQLGPLTDNGGPTQTHALLAGSPAINAGDLAAVAGASGVPQYDQRGEPLSRVFNGRIDIGAFELQPVDVLAGDYNHNGVVDAADVTVWRDTLGSTTDLRADGNGDGVINQADYAVWKSNFGSQLETPAELSVLPKPPAPPALGGIHDGNTLAAPLLPDSEATTVLTSRAEFAELSPPTSSITFGGVRGLPAKLTTRPAHAAPPLEPGMSRGDVALSAWLESTLVGVRSSNTVGDKQPLHDAERQPQSGQPNDALAAAIDEALAFALF